MPKVARELLLSASSFAVLLPAGRLVFKAPTDVTTPFAVIQAPGGVSLSGDDVVWSPLVQFDAYCPLTDPAAQEIAWDLAAAAAAVLGRARNVAFENVSYSGRLVDGPIPDVDTSRGESAALARTLIRAELTVHNR